MSYYQIIIPREINVVIADTQSSEANTRSIQQALISIFDGHFVMLDGKMYGFRNYQEFIEAAKEMCSCNLSEITKLKQMLLDIYVDTIGNGLL